MFASSAHECPDTWHMAAAGTFRADPGSSVMRAGCISDSRTGPRPSRCMGASDSCRSHPSHSHGIGGPTEMHAYVV